MGDNNTTTKTAQDLVNNIRKILDEAMEDAYKVDVKGNKAATTRLRKSFKLVADESKLARLTLAGVDVTVSRLGKNKENSSEGDEG